MRADYTITEGYVVGEMGLSEDQAKAIISSCSFRALKDLTQEEKSNLKSAIREVQTDIAKASDMIRLKRARIKKNKELLKKELSKAGNGSTSLSNLTRLSLPAIVSCIDVATAINNAKVFSDFVYGSVNELNYRIGLADTLDSRLEVQETNSLSTLSNLDKLYTSVSLGG
jgi:hypothetical protein